MRAPLNIIGGFYKDPNRHWSAQDTLNWIPVRAERTGTRTEWQFRDAPGVKPLVKLGVNSGGEVGFVEAGPGRGLRNVEGKLFAVAGTTLFEITNDLVSIPYGTIPGVGRVSMSHNQYANGNELLTVNGSAGYVLNTATKTFQKITDTGYPGAFIGDYVDGYLAQVEPLGRYWFHSDLADALEYSTLDQYEAEGDPDRIVTLHVSHREVLLFGADTIEPYVNAPSGAGIAPFVRASNTVIECGCSAKFSPKTIAGVVPFLDDKRVVQVLSGYSLQRISTVGIEQALSDCSRDEIASAYAYTFEDQGHKIYYLTVPGRFTFGYDFLTQEWHRRATFGLPDMAFVDVALWNGMWVALDRRYGRLYQLDWSYKLDACDPLVRKRITGVLSNNQNRVTVNELELLFNVGTEISVCQSFVEQPEGPTISGDAPDGLAGAPYSYAYSPTAGASPIVRTVLIGAGLPEGWTWSQSTATLSSADPQSGTITITIRTYDSNGLYAELSDEIDIAVATMGIGSSAISTYRTALSVAGDEWAITAADPGFSAGLLVPVSGTRFVAFNGTGGAVSYTDNFGASWVPSTGTFASGGCPAGYSKNGVVIIGVTTAELVYRSADSGASFAPVTTTNYWPNVPLFLTNSDVLVRENKTRNYLISADSFATFSAGMVSDIVISGRNCGFVHDGMAVFLGRSQANAKPAIAKSTTGLSETVFAFTDTAANHISAGCTNGSISEPMWVVATSGGEFYWSDDLGISWTKSTYVTPSGVPVSALSWNGVRFVAGTGVNLVQTTALILNSNLGRNDWGEVTNPLAADVFDIACIPVESP